MGRKHRRAEERGRSGAWGWSEGASRAGRDLVFLRKAGVHER